MPNNSISQVSLDDGTGNSTTYDIKDTYARNNIVPTFVGTTAEIAAAEQSGVITEGMLVYCTDDVSSTGFPSASDISLSSIAGMSADDVQEGIEELKSDLVANNQTAGVENIPFRFGCTDDGKYGYVIEEGGADTVIPFSSAFSTATLSTKTPTSYQEWWIGTGSSGAAGAGYTLGTPTASISENILTVTVPVTVRVLSRLGGYSDNVVNNVITFTLS